jgi:hypothetical protein
MRELARGNTIELCQESVERLKKFGFEPITDIKLDDSMVSYGVVRYVCVMENKDMKKWDSDHPQRKGKNNPFNRGNYRW